MKALAVERMAGVWPAEAEQAISASEVVQPWCLPVTLMTDSAVVRRGQPLFVPDFAEGWDVEILPCFTVCRLGKSIPARFASRYVNRMGLVARLVPHDESGVLGAPSALATNFDGALCLGDVIDFDAAPDEIGIDVEGCGCVSMEWQSLHLEDAIALVSRYMMLKTGDLIMPCRTGLRISAHVGMVIDASLNGEHLMHLKLK